jgi:hypothetical protein
LREKRVEEEELLGNYRNIEGHERIEEEEGFRKRKH